MKYKKWTLEEKLGILKLAGETGVVEACRQRKVSTGTFYGWKKKFEHKGEEGLKVNYQVKSKELRQAEEENKLLRKLLSDKEIELEAQRELLKKSLGRAMQERFSGQVLREI